MMKGSEASTRSQRKRKKNQFFFSERVFPGTSLRGLDDFFSPNVSYPIPIDELFLLDVEMRNANFCQFRKKQDEPQIRGDKSWQK